jgi:hypothetical protein
VKLPWLSLIVHVTQTTTWGGAKLSDAFQVVGVPIAMSN